jgi:hypothetical protein
MSRFLLCAVLLCAVALPASWAVAATVYIDPTCPNNGDGTLGTPCAASGGGAGPRNTWVGVTWTAGNIYAGRGGTTANVTNLIITASGTLGNPITVTSYGIGQHTLNGVGSYAIASIDRSHITYNNLHITSDAGRGIYFSTVTGQSTNLTVTKCLISHTVGAGIVLGDNTVPSYMTNVAITFNTFDTIGGTGIEYGSIPSGNSSTWDTHTITDNSFNNMGTTSTNSAISIVMTAGTKAKFTHVKIQRNSISNTNNGDVNPAYAIRLIRSPQGTGIETRFSGVTISDNTITTTRNGGIFLSSAGGANSIYRNTITNVDANAAIALFNSDSVVVEQNVISGVRPLVESSYIDGMGLDLEFSTNLTVRRNSIANNLGNAAHASGGQGIYVVGNTGTLVAGNLMSGNKNGLVIDGGVGGGASTVSHNTIVNSTNHGIWASTSYTQGNMLINNIVYGSAGWGIYDGGVGTKQTLINNLFFNSTRGDYGNRTAGLNDVQADPGFKSVTDFGLKSVSSPAHSAGSIAGTCVDFYGHVCWLPPDIGAFQYPPDGTPPSAPAGLHISKLVHTRLTPTPTACRRGGL